MNQFRHQLDVVCDAVNKRLAIIVKDHFQEFAALFGKVVAEAGMRVVFNVFVIDFWAKP